MKLILILSSLFFSFSIAAAPRFVASTPIPAAHYSIDGAALCATAKETLAYLNQGVHYDPQVIHEGKVMPISLNRVKATLAFICQHQNQLQDPQFITKHFDFIRWYPDLAQTQSLKRSKKLLANLPTDQILMTKYYVHEALASTKPSANFPYALYALPADEASLSFEEAETKPGLTRFQYGKQAILKGALRNKNVPVLAYLKREDLEAALMQGTLVAQFKDQGGRRKFFNVHRNNRIAYDKAKNPYLQERFWYFKEVAGVKGYGKDAMKKITVNTQVTFAGDLEHFGLGKVLLVQYPNHQGQITTRAGILADTGGAFANNLYQVDFLAGTYAGRDAFAQANRYIPDYVTAYFMVLKK